jgi:hypothetical protein
MERTKNTNKDYLKIVRFWFCGKVEKERESLSANANPFNKLVNFELQSRNYSHGQKGESYSLFREISPLVLGSNPRVKLREMKETNS